ncbi:hypothetical protein COP2_034025 [Malus domestica]
MRVTLAARVHPRTSEPSSHLSHATNVGIAYRQVAQVTPATKWQPKETMDNEDDRQPPKIMDELLQGKKVIDHDFETTIEESKKKIKLLFLPREMKARLEHF